VKLNPLIFETIKVMAAFFLLMVISMSALIVSEILWPESQAQIAADDFQ